MWVEIGVPSSESDGHGATVCQRASLASGPSVRRGHAAVDSKEELKSLTDRSARHRRRLILLMRLSESILRRLWAECALPRDAAASAGRRIQSVLPTWPFEESDELKLASTPPWSQSLGGSWLRPGDASS